MEHSTKRSSRSRWASLGSAALAVATVAVIGLTTVTPAKADWRRDDHGGVGFGFSIGTPGYGYYPYPAYPAYPAYSYPYYGGYSPYYYGGYPYYYSGPSVSFDFRK